MSLVFLAIGANPPWTEGRKNLVRDLAEEIGARGKAVRVLAGPPAAHALLQTLVALFALWALLLRGKAEGVVQFPYGRFGGVRGRVNRFVANLVEASVRRTGVPLLTLLYSADGITLQEAVDSFGSIAAVGVSHPNVHMVHLGASVSAWSTSKADAQFPVRLLFLCGYQTPSAAAVTGVLDERGLGRLLSACDGIARDVELTIAIPFLRDAKVCDRIQKEIAARCPSLPVRLDATVAPETALLEHDIFVFPYVAEHSVFVPTSLLEAMWLGVPVVASDRRMYRALTKPTGIANCELDAEDSIRGLRMALQNCIDNLPAAIDQARRARCHVMAEWNIARAANDVLHALSVA